jgi:oligoendopeptidase F
MDINKVVQRSEIPENYKWDIETIYKSKNDLLEDVNRAKELINKLSSYKDNIVENGENLHNCLKLYDEAGVACDRIYVYCSMKRDEDTSNSYGQELADIGENLHITLRSAAAFISPKIIAAGSDRIMELINEHKGLDLYRQTIEDTLRLKEHFLSIDEENLLAKSQEATLGYSNIFRMLNGADMQFPKVKNNKGEELELTNSSISLYLQSRDRELRKNAFETLYGKYGEFKNTYGAILAGNVKKDVFYSKTRNYKSSLESALFNDNIPENIYYNVINSVANNIDKLDEYCKMKRESLKLEKLHIYDLYAPIVEDIDLNVDYETAKSMVLEALSVLGEEYVEVLKEAFNNKWIDVYENKGKRSGAYSWGSYDTKPYILLNYKNTLRDVLTLAHELGHSIHSYFSRKHQPYPYSSYTIFCAEVASTTNECIMYLYLMNKLKGNERRNLINDFLESIRTVYYRQTMFAEFELKTHSLVENGEAINGEKFSGLWRELYNKYYGRECVIDSGIELEWARIPHFYNAFYVYKYVTGLSAAISIAKGILDDNSNTERYINFLKSGSTDYSLELLKKTGVDMTTSKPLDDTANMFKYLLDEFKK